MGRNSISLSGWGSLKPRPTQTPIFIYYSHSNGGSPVTPLDRDTSTSIPNWLRGTGGGRTCYVCQLGKGLALHFLGIILSWLTFGEVCRCFRLCLYYQRPCPTYLLKRLLYGLTVKKPHKVFNHAKWWGWPVPFKLWSVWPGQSSQSNIFMTWSNIELHFWQANPN